MFWVAMKLSLLLAWHLCGLQRDTQHLGILSRHILTYDVGMKVSMEA